MRTTNPVTASTVALLLMATGCSAATPPAVTVTRAADASEAESSELTNSDLSTPELRGADPKLAALVDCGDEGVANVHLVYGQVDRTVLVGRNPVTQSIGGVRVLSEHFTLGRGDENVLFTIITSPTRGSCVTTLTDYDSGNVIVEKNTAGRALLRVLVTGRP